MAFENFLSTWTPSVLGVLRIIAGFLFTAHGTQKLFNYPVSASGPADLLSFMGFAGVLEIVGGLMIMTGLFTRMTAFILSGMMAVAYFIAHAPAGFLPIENQGEAAVLYSFVFLYLAFAGGGAFSLDGLLRRRSVPVPANAAVEAA